MRRAYICEAGHFYDYRGDDAHGPTCRCEWIDKTDGSPLEPVDCNAPAYKWQPGDPTKGEEVRAYFHRTDLPEPSDEVFPRFSSEEKD